MSDALRAHLVRLLDWEEAHAGFDKALAGLPADKRGALAPGFEHSPWQLLEHLRIAQADILDFCVNPSYVHDRTWPDDYWPKAPAPPDAAAWDASIARYKAELDAMKELVQNQADLFGSGPDGKRQPDVPARDLPGRRSRCVSRRTDRCGATGAERVGLTGNRESGIVNGE